MRLHNSVGSAWKCDLHARLDIACHTFISCCKNMKEETLIFMVNCLENVNEEDCLNLQIFFSCINYVAEISDLRGRYSVSFGKSFLGVLTLKKAAKGSFEISSNICPKTRSHIPE